MNIQLRKMLLVLTMLLLSYVAQAQVYKWVDASGQVSYSDMPPPKTVAKVEIRSFAAADGLTVALPFALAQAVKNMPIVLMTTSHCLPCDDGRLFLKQNGIPFAEKTVATNADIEKLNQSSGGTQLPVLIVGKTRLKGYNASDWRSMLSQAGYPANNELPSDYSFPAAQPLSPIPVKAAAQPTAQPVDSPSRDPNGFQF